MNRIKFTIIVPVYNVEKYLSECIESILKQTYTNYEVILVDDGSKDKSPEICDKYAHIDNRVKVIHKENGGLSDARNFGIAAAKGDYLVFVDSDDWIEPEALNCMNSATSDHPDVIISTIIEYFENDGTQRINDSSFQSFINSHKMTKLDVIEWTCWVSKNTWPAPKYIVSREFTNRFNLRFLKGRLHEDMDWTSRCLYYGSKFSFMTQPWYFHRLNRENSITSSVNVKHFIDMIEMAQIHLNFPEGIDKETHNEIFRRFMCSTYAWLRYAKNCSNEQLDEVIACLDRNKLILKCAPKTWNKVFVAIYRIFGAKTSFKMLFWFAH